MLELTVAFYKGEGLRRDKVIRWWTGSPYSHVELVMPSGMIAGIRPPYNPYISKRAAGELAEEEWELVKLPVTEKQLKKVKDFIESTKGQGYDWVGMIASHLTPFKVKFPKKWYCSEWIAHALRVSRVIDWKKARIFERAKISPATLHDIISLK